MLNVNHQFILPVESLSFTLCSRGYRNSAISLETNHCSECQPTCCCQSLHLFLWGCSPTQQTTSARELTLFRTALHQRLAGVGGKHPLLTPVFISLRLVFCTISPPFLLSPTVVAAIMLPLLGVFPSLSHFILSCHCF